MFKRGKWVPERSVRTVSRRSYVSREGVLKGKDNKDRGKEEVS